MMSAWRMAALAALLIAVPAFAGEPDRSSLSYEDNVTINAACFAAHVKGDDAFDACVTSQMAQLKQHPAPDRTQLSDAQAREIERDCNYLRRVGIGAYNDCLTKEATDAPATADDAAADKDQIASSAGLAKAMTEPNAQVEDAAVVQLPLPPKVLPHRPGPAGRESLSAEALYKKLERSVFVVGAARSLGDARARDIVQGSAVAITDHLLLTNCHVVDHRPLIVLLQDKTIIHAKLVAADIDADRCVLESEGEALVPVAGVRAFSDLAVGEHVYALGAPRALERTLTEGLVSGLRTAKGHNLIQTSAPLSPGSSGGGLFDERGNLLGITTLASLPGSQNLNFAIAVSDFWE
jgi:S1-C subfamily serine protease